MTDKWQERQQAKVEAIRKIFPTGHTGGNNSLEVYGRRDGDTDITVTIDTFDYLTDYDTVEYEPEWQAIFDHFWDNEDNQDIAPHEPDGKKRFLAWLRPYVLGNIECDVWHTINGDSMLSDELSIIRLEIDEWEGEKDAEGFYTGENKITAELGLKTPDENTVMFVTTSDYYWVNTSWVALSNDGCYIDTCNATIQADGPEGNPVPDHLKGMGFGAFCRHFGHKTLQNRDETIKNWHKYRENTPHGYDFKKYCQWAGFDLDYAKYADDDSLQRWANPSSVLAWAYYREGALTAEQFNAKWLEAHPTHTWSEQQKANGVLIESCRDWYDYMAHHPEVYSYEIFCTTMELPVLRDDLDNSWRSFLRFESEKWAMACFKAYSAKQPHTYEQYCAMFGQRQFEVNQYALNEFKQYLAGKLPFIYWDSQGSAGNWRNDDRGILDLDDYPVTDDIDLKGKGTHIYLDPETEVAHCPITGYPLSAH